MQILKRPGNESQYPIKVIQFGEGNFLRAFVDWVIDILNEKSDFSGSIAVVQPLENGMIGVLNDQDGLYHHIRQGIEGNKIIDEVRLIKCISKSLNPYSNTPTFFQLAEEPEIKVIFSNTTEAGIAFDPEDKPKAGEIAKTFPGKLTQLLMKRCSHFNGDLTKGVAVIPCELIDQNGTKLKDCVLNYAQIWGLGNDFRQWLDKSCSFANTLVDRIVPGYPKEEIEKITERIGYNDKLVVKSESFHLFVIQVDDWVKEIFPAHQHGLNVKYVQDITPYRTQKVRILNGAHTSMVPVGLLYGLETVSEAVNDPETGKLIREMIFDEIVPTIQIPGEDPAEFAEQVISRFQNPFIRHELITISLNSISKFKVRVLPTILDYIKIKNKLPNRLIFAFACLIHLYLQDKFPLKDDDSNLNFFKSLKSEDADTIIENVLGNVDLWGQDLRAISGLKEQILEHFNAISSEQMKEVIFNI